MGSIIVYALVILWLVAMVPAVAVPFFTDRSKHGANVTPPASTIPFRQNAKNDKGHRPPVDRSAA
jgi:hypothetical protein